MTAEQFHDALTLLPEDLVERADKIRSRKRTRIPWKSCAAIAACFAVLLALAYRHAQKNSAPTALTAVPFAAHQEEAADSAEAPRMEAAKGAPADSDSDAAADSAIIYPCVETPCRPNAAVIDRSISILTSRADLEDYFEEMGEYYQLNALRDACHNYDEDWFMSSDLLLIPVDGVSAGQTCIVTEMSCQEGHCNVVITLTGEETDELTNYRVAVPVEKGSVTDTQNIAVTYKSDTTN